MTLRFQAARRNAMAPIVVESVQELRDLSDLGAAARPIAMLADATDPAVDGRRYYKQLGDPVGTHVDDGVNVIVPTGGTGSDAWIAYPNQPGTGGAALPAATEQNQILVSQAGATFPWAAGDLDMGRY